MSDLPAQGTRTVNDVANVGHLICCRDDGRTFCGAPPSNSNVPVRELEQCADCALIEDAYQGCCPIDLTTCAAEWFAWEREVIA